MQNERQYLRPTIRPAPRRHLHIGHHYPLRPSYRIAITVLSRHKKVKQKARSLERRVTYFNPLHVKHDDCDHVENSVAGIQAPAVERP